VLPAHTGVHIPAHIAEKSTTVYVGKIAPTLPDNVIRTLLEACGSIRSWKRQEDPETKQPKGFGFCEFEDAEGVLRAMRLLNNLALDGQELLLKCNTATQK
jgi:RNA-binding protein 25